MGKFTAFEVTKLDPLGNTLKFLSLSTIAFSSWFSFFGNPVTKNHNLYKDCWRFFYLSFSIYATLFLSLCPKTTSLCHIDCLRYVLLKKKLLFYFFDKIIVVAISNTVGGKAGFESNCALGEKRVLLAILQSQLH